MQNFRAMNRGALSDPSFIGSLKRTLMKKRGTPQNTKGLLEKPSDEKRGTLTKLKGAPKKDL
jgi:hypothetical protein